jgi:hypothetical protein
VPKRARSDSGVWRDLHQRLVSFFVISHTHREVVAVAAPPTGPLKNRPDGDLTTDVLDFGQIRAKLRSLVPLDLRRLRPLEDAEGSVLRRRLGQLVSSELIGERCLVFLVR